MFYREQNDETLVLLTLAGEQKAYEELVTRYQNAVISAALSVTRNQFMAEDAAQDAFVTAWMKLNTLQSPEKYRSWVCRIAHNCALNMITRFQQYLPLETLENIKVSEEQGYDPSELYVLSEEKDQVHESIDRLPEKVRTIIHLHYFEGLSISEIADKMRISEGTVKWQLHDGRKRIRKELCAMNEKLNDTMVQRVMKKVEELKLWQMKNDKSGFEIVYKDVLRDVEELPESKDKYHALADVLMSGWWWLPGEKNDALFERIREAAERGKNEEVMTFIVEREDSKVWGGGATIDFILNKQIPRLEKSGFVKTLAREWFWLGLFYCQAKNHEKGFEAYRKAKTLLTPADVYYWMVDARIKTEQLLIDKYKEKDIKKFHIGNGIGHYRMINKVLHRWSRIQLGSGDLNTAISSASSIFENSSKCDSRFFVNIAVGESFVGSDGTTLTFNSDSETVETPCGVFENCQLWTTRCSREENGIAFYRSYYKDGVGIVKHEINNGGYIEKRILKSYEIKGGSGLLPMFEGNTWEYTTDYSPESMIFELTYKVVFFNGDHIFISTDYKAERLKYDENVWVDMIDQIRNEYWNVVDGKHRLCDISLPIGRAENLARTPVEKAHTKAACSVARRILETDRNDPNRKATGLWNFFSKNLVRRQNGCISISHNFRWSFEWKASHGGIGPDYPLLFNDIYGILQNAANCIWSDEWRGGASPVVEYILWGRNPVKTQIVCENVEVVNTKAGSFDNCLKITLDTSGLSNGLAYRGGKKEYYFAEGIGIVRTVNYYCEGYKTAVYELTEYEGRGQGFMPVEDGLMRRYDAIGLTDGHIASAVYTYVEDDNGEVLIFADREGIRQELSPITSYSYIHAERTEMDLWRENKREEYRALRAVNNFKLLLHFMFRPTMLRGHGMAPKAAEWYLYLIKMIDEMVAENGEVPRAWWGVYAGLHFMEACTLFGCKKEPERALGYQYLEKTLELYPRWLEIPKGEALEVGRENIYGGIRFIKGKNLLELPDGTRELLEYSCLDDFRSPSNMYYGMTALQGWEWFNSVREEEQFKEYIERFRILSEKYS